MLAALMLAAVLTEVPGPVASGMRTACPTLPVESIVPAMRVCDTLELTGRIDPSFVTLDPAFNGKAPESELARPAPGPAQIVAYDKDGRAIFTFPFAANGAFRLVLPLGKEFAASVARLTLTANGTTYERVPIASEAPAAEAIESDASHLVFAWNAHLFPGVRISNGNDGTPVANLEGSQTYEQVNVESKSSRLIVSFSNGVRSVTRTVNVFGRR